MWDNEQKVPYSYKGNQWVGYDNPESVKLKAEYAKSKQLGGVMVWSIEQEDARGICGQGKFPLMTALWQGLGGSATPGTTPTPDNAPKTTKSPGPVTTTSTTTAAPSRSTFICAAPGYYRDPVDCNVYYVCQSTGNG